MTEFFKHDVNARHNPKLRRLRQKHGAAGIGLYWYLIEEMYEAEGYVDMTTVESVAFDLRMEDGQAEAIISLMVELGLIACDSGHYTADRVQESLEERGKISEMKRSAANARYGKFPAENAGALHVNAGALHVNANKEEERREKSKSNTEEYSFDSDESLRNPTPQRMIDTPEAYPFEAFWQAYGRKQGKAKAQALWARLPVKDRQAAMEGIPRYHAHCPDPTYRKHPERYISHRVWEDELPPPGARTHAAHRPPSRVGDRAVISADTIAEPLRLAAEADAALAALRAQQGEGQLVLATPSHPPARQTGSA